ncbi:hypothetical protein [Corynebacterium cystitidis]|uniref:hypothetical protein n=1 Tax=Corynebacterium cystitidis TaxID=35757 RepID=UPI00211EA2D4|nr:hypothetical protein [Corynebacterium cystitidis]
MRRTSQLLTTAYLGARRLSAEVKVVDQTKGDVSFPGAAVAVADFPFMSEFRDELLEPADRPILFEIHVSSWLNRRQFLARLIRCFTIIVLRFPNPWRSLSPSDELHVNTLVDDAFSGRYPEAVRAAWAVIRDNGKRQPREGGDAQFEVDLTVWIAKKRLGIRSGEFDRGIEAFIADRKTQAPSGVNFPRVLRAATLVERALANKEIGIDLTLPAGNGAQLLALVAAEFP